MMLDDQPQCVSGRAVQRQASRHAHRQLAAHFGMIAVAVGLADVVEDQRQVKNERPVQSLKEGRISIMRRLLGLPNAVKLLNADKRMFVGGVLMIKFMLHEARELAEL